MNVEDVARALWSRLRDAESEAGAVRLLAWVLRKERMQAAERAREAFETPRQAKRRRDEFVRAGGGCECSCGETYHRHLHDPKEPWLTVLCDGRRVKL